MRGAYNNLILCLSNSAPYDAVTRPFLDKVTFVTLKTNSYAEYITEEVLERLELTEDEAFTYAKQNTAKSSFITLLGNLIGEQNADENILIMSANDTVYGSAAMCIEENLVQIGNRLNGDYYIIPSSTHEIIAVPTSQRTYKEVCDAVKSSNKEISAFERLGKHPYLYHRDTGKITW